MFIHDRPATGMRAHAAGRADCATVPLLVRVMVWPIPRATELDQATTPYLGPGITGPAGLSTHTLGS
jgi:hypothetical protein